MGPAEIFLAIICSFIGSALLQGILKLLSKYLDSSNKLYVRQIIVFFSITSIIILFFVCWKLNWPVNIEVYFEIANNWMKLHVWLVFATGLLAGVVIIWIFYNIVPVLIQLFLGIEPHLSIYWETNFSEGDKKYKELVELNQKIYRVDGKIFFYDYEAREEKIYIFKGVLKDRILTAMYKSREKSDFERGAFVLEYISKGNVFKGYYVKSFKNPKDTKASSEFQPTNYRWRKLKRKKFFSLKNEFKHNLKKQSNNEQMDHT